jgi:hypothetical protein
MHFTKWIVGFDFKICDKKIQNSPVSEAVKQEGEKTLSSNITRTF